MQERFSPELPNAPPEPSAQPSPNALEFQASSPGSTGPQVWPAAGGEMSAQTVGERAISADWGLLSERFEVAIGGRRVRVEVYSRSVNVENRKYIRFTSVDADTGEVLNSELSPL